MRTEVQLNLKCQFCGKKGAAKLPSKYIYIESKASCPNCNGEENEWLCAVEKLEGEE